MSLDADCIYGTLYQGSRPPMGHTLLHEGFSALVLCAEEYQPDARNFPGLQIHYVPFDDDPTRPLDRETMQRIIEAASFTARVLARGDKILVTCWMGINRSGLVSALALHLLLDLPGSEVIRLVRSKRQGALSNPVFRQTLERIAPLAPQ